MTSYRSSRGSALVAVLVIVVIGILLAAGIMSRAVSRVEDSTLALKRSGSRAMAWSGVQAAMATIANQREQMLMGGDVTLTDARSWEYADADGPGLWTVSLQSLDAAGGLAVAEAACINVNTATEEQLGKVAALGSAGAAAVMERRSRGPILAVEQLATLVSVQRASPSADAAPSPSEFSAADGLEKQLPISSNDSTSSSADEGQGLTALSADATVMIADGKTPRYRASELAQDATPQVKAEQDARLGAGSGAVRVWVKRPAQERTFANLIADLEAAGIEAGEWGKTLDAIESGEDLFVLGRVDINRADEAVLATLPGVDAELASNLVRVRSTLDESGRRDLAWPVVSGAMDAKVFAGIVDLITTRTLQYRIRVQAGRIIRQDATGVESDEFGVAKSSEGPVTDRCVFEAVIDVAGDVPRIAYLRDVTLLDSAMSVVDAMAATQQPEISGIDLGEMSGASQDAADLGSSSMSSGMASDESIQQDERTEAAPSGALETDGMKRSGGLDLGGGLDRLGGLGLDRSSQSSSEPGEQASQGDTPSDPVPAVGTVRRADPRLGRWNTTAVRASEKPPAGAADSVRSSANDQAKSSGGKDAANKPGNTAGTKPERKAGTK